MLLNYIIYCTNTVACETVERAKGIKTHKYDALADLVDFRAVRLEMLGLGALGQGIAFDITQETSPPPYRSGFTLRHNIRLAFHSSYILVSFLYSYVLPFLFETSGHY